MVIAGIDPGTVNTGYGIIHFDSSKLSYINSGIVTPDKTLPIEKRLLFIFEEISSVLEKYKPNLFSVETPFYGKNIQSAFKVGYAKGILVLAAAKLSINIVEFSPREIKKAVTGRGSAEKAQVGYMVKSLLNLQKEMFPDETDALASAICAAFNIESSISKSSSWKDFISKNPHRIKNN